MTIFKDSNAILIKNFGDTEVPYFSVSLQTMLIMWSLNSKVGILTPMSHNLQNGLRQSRLCFSLKYLVDLLT